MNNKPLSDNLQNHAECPGMAWEDQIIAYFQDKAPQQQTQSLSQDLAISYHVKSIAFDCVSCGKELMLEKRTGASVASGVFCLCGQGVQYFINWNEMVLRMIAEPAAKEQKK